MPELDEEWQDDDNDIFPLPEPLMTPTMNDASLDSMSSKTSTSIPSMDPPDFLDSIHSSDMDPLDYGSPVGPAACQSDEFDLCSDEKSMLDPPSLQQKWFDIEIASPPNT